MSKMSFGENKNFPSALGIAITLHLILFVCLILTLKDFYEPPTFPSEPKIIQASLIFDTKPQVQTPVSAPPVVTQSPPKPKPVVVEKKTPPAPVKTPLPPPKVPVKPQVSVQKKEQEEALRQQALIKQQQAEALKQQQAAAANRAKGLQDLVDKYKALIQQSINENWSVPAGINTALVTELLIRLAPDGTVIQVTVLKSSGNDLLDQSAIQAVQKASPLPVPDNLEAFHVLREIRLKLKPELTI